MASCRPWNPDQNVPAVEQPLLLGLPVAVSLRLFLSSVLGCRVTSSACGISVLTSPLSIISEICLPLHNAHGASVSSPLILTCLHTKKLRPVYGVMICRMVTKGQSRALNPGFGLLAQLAFLTMLQVAQHMLLVFSAGFLANSPPGLDVPRGWDPISLRCGLRNRGAVLKNGREMH